MNKSDRIRRLLAKGLTAPEIAKRLKVKMAYVHTIKWLDKKNEAAPPKKARFNSPRSRLINDLFQMKKAMDVIEKKPTKLLVQPQYKDAAMKILADNDLVNHPPHYKSGGIETIDFIEAKDLNYRLGNVVKYVARAGKKATDPVQDLEKALWYLQREITARKNA
jgi:hypothetical protein